MYGGAPLEKSCGDWVSKLGSLRTFIGSTEGGLWATLNPADPEDWEYIHFHPAFGAKFEKTVDNLHELIIERNPQTGSTYVG
jgi:hypothetical protein